MKHLTFWNLFFSSFHTNSSLPPCWSEIWATNRDSAWGAPCPVWARKLAMCSGCLVAFVSLTTFPVGFLEITVKVKEGACVELCKIAYFFPFSGTVFTETETWLAKVFILWQCLFVYISLIYAVYVNYSLMWKYFDINFSHFFDFLNNFIMRMVLNHICSPSFWVFI